MLALPARLSAPLANGSRTMINPFVAMVTVSVPGTNVPIV